MNKKGFTLIELLAVIIVLAIILSIAVPSITSLIDNYTVSTSIVNQKMVVKAVKSYLASRSELFPSTNGSTIEIKLSDLQSASLIANIKDPKDKNTNCDGYVLVTKLDDNKFDYSPRLTCSEGTIVNSVASDGLVVNYKLDNNAIDSSLNGWNGSNGPITGATGTLNRFGTGNSAMNFNGSQYINTYSDISWNNTNQITISFWVRPDNIADSNRGILGKNNYEWTFYQNINNLGFVYWDYAGGHAGGMEIIATNVLTANKWTYLTYTWDGVTGKIYIDGNLNNSKTSLDPSKNRNHTDPIMIGGNIYTWGNSYFRGSVDDIKIYSRAFTATEILNNYKLEKTESL